jgi:hypothetical protein
VTHLRKIMLEELRRNYSQATVRVYLMAGAPTKGKEFY